MPALCYPSEYDIAEKRVSGIRRAAELAEDLKVFKPAIIKARTREVCLKIYAFDACDVFANSPDGYLNAGLNSQNSMQLLTFIIIYLNARIDVLREDLSTDLLVLQSHLDGLLDSVQNNSMILRRFQAFEMGLLRIDSLADMLDYFLGDAMELLNLDVLSICLLDERGDIVRILEEEGCYVEKMSRLVIVSEKEPMQRFMEMTGPAYLGHYEEKFAVFFPFIPKPSAVAILPLMRRGKMLGTLNFGRHPEERFIFAMATDLIEHLVSVISICLENILNYETMRRTSLMDTLTGVNNRRFLEQRMGEELDRCKRSDQPLSCLFLDVDHFKRINDTFGHQAGDQVLAIVAAAIKQQLRSNDVLARYGGEEFVALLTNINEGMAYEVAERIRERIETLPIKVNDHDISATISIGTATFQPDVCDCLSNAEVTGSLIRSADQALYKAKSGGRNRVECGGLIADLSGINMQKIA